MGVAFFPSRGNFSPQLLTQKSFADLIYEQYLNSAIFPVSRLFFDATSDKTKFDDLIYFLNNRDI
jgi:hypothetical protein